MKQVGIDYSIVLRSVLMQSSGNEILSTASRTRWCPDWCGKRSGAFFRWDV